MQTATSSSCWCALPELNAKPFTQSEFSNQSSTKLDIGNDHASTQQHACTAAYNSDPEH